MTDLKITISGDGKRSCSECQLCCKLLPVLDIGKVGGIKCQHQKFGVGCKIYKQLGPLHSCSLWSCVWLIGNDAADLHRPDRSHYVIDPMPDFVTINDDGETMDVPAIQVWVDPKHPDAHRDAALRAYLERSSAARGGAVAIIRYSPYDGFVLIPPSMCSDNQWHEHVGDKIERTHTAAEIFNALT